MITNIGASKIPQHGTGNVSGPYIKVPMWMCGLAMEVSGSSKVSRPPALLSTYQSFMPLYPSIYSSIFLLIYIPMYCTIYLSIYLSACLFVFLSVCLSVCLSMYLSVCLSVYVSISLSIYPSIYLARNSLYTFLRSTLEVPKAQKENRQALILHPWGPSLP